MLDGYAKGIMSAAVKPDTARVPNRKPTSGLQELAEKITEFGVSFAISNVGSDYANIRIANKPMRLQFPFEIDDVLADAGLIPPKFTEMPEPLSISRLVGQAAAEKFDAIAQEAALKLTEEAPSAEDDPAE